MFFRLSSVLGWKVVLSGFVLMSDVLVSCPSIWYIYFGIRIPSMFLLEAFRGCAQGKACMYSVFVCVCL